MCGGGVCAKGTEAYSRGTFGGGGVGRWCGRARRYLELLSLLSDCRVHLRQNASGNIITLEVEFVLKGLSVACSRMALAVDRDIGLAGPFIVFRGGHEDPFGLVDSTRAGPRHGAAGRIVHGNALFECFF